MELVLPEPLEPEELEPEPEELELELEELDPELELEDELELLEVELLGVGAAGSRWVALQPSRQAHRHNTATYFISALRRESLDLACCWRVQLLCDD